MKYKWDRLPTNLHCSQTYKVEEYATTGLFPLRIYTVLKQPSGNVIGLFRLFPLRIYTALKPLISVLYELIRLFPLRIYTALKHIQAASRFQPVCFPYKFTLLSNSRQNSLTKKRFVSPTNLHCSQTLFSVSMA